MRKNLILENGEFFDIPADLHRILKTRFQGNREYWMNFKEAHNHNNCRVTVERLQALEAGTNLIFHARFDDTDQVHFFVAVMHTIKKMGKRLNLYMHHNNIRAAFDRYLLIEKPEVMNVRLIEVVNYHNIFQIHEFQPDDLIRFDYIDHIEEDEEAIRYEIKPSQVATKTAKTLTYDVEYSGRLEAPQPHPAGTQHSMVIPINRDYAYRALCL
jgi:hypothetical protein